MNNNNHFMPFGSIMNALQGQLTVDNWEQVCDKVMAWCKFNTPDEPFPSSGGPRYNPVENKVCAECGSPLKLVEAGVSKKTGRPYNAFWSCPNRHPQN